MSRVHTTSTVAGRAIGALAGGLVAIVLWAPASGAQDPPDYVGQPAPAVDVPKNDPTGGDVGSDRTTRSNAADADAAQASRLALTGGDILGLTALGAAAVGTGAVLTRRSRRSRRAPITGRSAPQARPA